jgi:hypothetical protein
MKILRMRVRVQRVLSLLLWQVGIALESICHSPPPPSTHLLHMHRFSQTKSIATNPVHVVEPHPTPFPAPSLPSTLVSPKLEGLKSSGRPSYTHTSSIIKSSVEAFHGSEQKALYFRRCLQCMRLPVRIRLIESNAKCRRLNKLTSKGTLRQIFICRRPPPLRVFLG